MFFGIWELKALGPLMVLELWSAKVLRGPNAFDGLRSQDHGRSQ